MKTSLTFEFASLAEAAEFAPILLSAKLPEHVAPEGSHAVTASARTALKVQKVAEPDWEPAEVRAPATVAEEVGAPADEEVAEVVTADVAGPLSSEYLAAIEKARPIIGVEGLKKALLAAGHVTKAGTPGSVKGSARDPEGDPAPSPSMQFKIMGEVEKLVAARAAKAPAPAKEEASGAEDLSEEGYQSAIMEAHAVVGNKGWQDAVVAAGHTNSAGKPISPKSAPPEKRAAILAHLRKLIAEKRQQAA